MLALVISRAARACSRSSACANTAAIHQRHAAFWPVRKASIPVLSRPRRTALRKWSSSSLLVFAGTGSPG
ncbi:hypothetical protein CGZ98_13250 [Enemella evansiae]|uniref:hypothetical protein n=1 Tax=Enemella evansiae TaxID=2016499 RepID=UPI000B97473A|nr:hypothetical protein [Enemella evansiae]OYO10059.1 hypothetical protein CGZ98_13250 [Enemella evansiae]